MDSSSNESESNNKLLPDFALCNEKNQRDDRPVEKTTKTARDEKENVELEAYEAVVYDQEPTTDDGGTEEELPPVRSTSSKASSEAGDSENEFYIEEEDEKELTHPGAVAVPGAPPFSSPNASSPGRNAEYESSPMDEISAYVVEEGVTLEQLENIRRESIAQLLAEAVEAEDVKPERGWRDWRRWALVGAGAIILAGVLTAILVPLRNQRSDNETSAPLRNQLSDNESSTRVDERILAYVERRSTEGGGWLAFTSAVVRHAEFSNVTTGLMGYITCDPRPCVENDGHCKIGGNVYVPGCCLGSECTEETQCGESCPSVPESRYLTDPNDSECHSKNCYTCNKVDGQDVWMLTQDVYDIDCLEVGTAIRKKNGQKYKWAIVCGAIIEGGNKQANYGLGDYACNAYRTGAGFKHEIDGIVSNYLRCQFISLGHCGCAPADVYTFGLPEPTGPCLPGGDCPFLCADAGKEYARNLCHAFGGIEWWEGDNFMSWNLFDPVEDVTLEELEIYIKSEDP